MIKRLLSIFLTLTLTSLFLCTPASAASFLDGIENLSGDGQYMSSAYINNYAFDSEELGMLDAADAIGLDISNVIFSFCHTVIFFMLSAFRITLQFNIADLAGEQLDTVQTALSNSIFEPLFIVGFIGVAFALLKKLARRNTTGIFAEFGKVMLILIFVALLTRNTSEVLTGTTTIARDLGISVVMEMNEQDTGASQAAFVDEIVGVLWGDLVHRPWIAMEFDGAQAESDVQAILSKSHGSEDRQNVINDYIAAHPGAFSKSGIWARYAVLLLFAISSILKAVIYIACAVAVFIFQLLAIFYALMGVIILLLAMFDALGGLHLISDWLKRMLETQLMTLVTTMLLGFIVWFGGIMTDVFSGLLGWLGGMLLQAVVFVVLFAFREKVFRGLVNISKNPRAAAQHLAAPSTAAFISGFRQYNQSLDGSFPQTRLDRKEQMSRIRLNESRIEYYGEEQELSAQRIALTQTQQQKEELMLEHEEAKKERRVEREKARAAAEENRRSEPTVKRPQTKQPPPEAPPEPEEPVVARPVTQKPSAAQNVQEQTPDAARPASLHTGEGVPAYAPSSDPQNAPQEMQGKHSQEDPPVERPRTEEPTAQPLNAADSGKNESAGAKENDAAASAAAAVEQAQNLRSHTQTAAPSRDGAKADLHSKPSPAIERPTTQAGVVPRDMPKMASEADQERVNTGEASVRPSIPQSAPAPVQSTSEPIYAPSAPSSGEQTPEVVGEKVTATQQAETKAMPQPATQSKASSSAPAQDAGAATKASAAAARAERKHREAARTVAGGNISYSVQLPEEKSTEKRPQLREALNTDENKEGEVTENGSNA